MRFGFHLFGFDYVVGFDRVREKPHGVEEAESEPAAIEEDARMDQGKAARRERRRMRAMTT